MVQRKTCQVIESYKLQPETRIGQEHLKILGPEMMMKKKRTKLRRKLKDDYVSESGKPQEPTKRDLVVKVTGGSRNYMKDTSSSEPRKENKKRFNLCKNQTGPKHDSRCGVNKERRNNKQSSRIARGFTKAPSFKRCSQRATCSSTMKDSKFPEYLMLNHGGTHDEVNGTSVLKVCPYTCCSLNGHLHAVQYPPLKSFIYLKRRSLKSQNSVKMKEFVEMCVEEEKKECENANEVTCEVDIETQTSETVSVGAPCSETDSDADSDSAEMVRFSEGDHEIESRDSDLEKTLINDSVKEIQEKANRDEDTESGCLNYEVIISMMKNSEGDNASEDEDDADEEILKNKAEHCKEESQDRIEGVSMITEAAKVPFSQEESDARNSLKRPKIRGNSTKENLITEKVNLKHQDMDERKSSKDWMFDYALQRTVTKLSSAGKKKVALLIEAFETAQPIKPQVENLH